MRSDGYPVPAQPDSAAAPPRRLGVNGLTKQPAEIRCASCLMKERAGWRVNRSPPYDAVVLSDNYAHTWRIEYVSVPAGPQG